MEKKLKFKNKKTNLNQNFFLLPYTYIYYYITYFFINVEIPQKLYFLYKIRIKICDFLTF